MLGAIAARTDQGDSSSESWRTHPAYGELQYSGTSVTRFMVRVINKTLGPVSVPGMTLNPLIVGVIIFVAVSAGAFAGWAMRQRLPEHHLTDETKSVVSVSMATVATISALVLGLLISNANSSFGALGGEVTTLSAQLLRLDRILSRYGSDADPARQTLREYANQKAGDLFPEDSGDVRLNNPSTYQLLQQLEDEMLELKPANTRDQWWLGQAMTLAGKIGDARWLISQQVGQGTPKAFVALLGFWLTSLFVSFGLFSPRNVTTALFLTLCAMAVAGAVGMILELEKGFGALVHISPEPMRQAVKALEAEKDGRKIGENPGSSHLLPPRRADGSL